MKKLTITMSDDLYEFLERMCETEFETPESIALALIHDTLFEDEIDELWEKIDELEEQLIRKDDQEGFKRVSDLLFGSTYSCHLPSDESFELLKTLADILEQIVNNGDDGVKLQALLDELETKVGKEVPRE